MSTYVRSAVTGVFLSVPVVVAFLDTVGYPAPIEGYSMRVGGLSSVSRVNFIRPSPTADSKSAGKADP